MFDVDPLSGELFSEEETIKDIFGFLEREKVFSDPDVMPALISGRKVTMSVRDTVCVVESHGMYEGFQWCLLSIEKIDEDSSVTFPYASVLRWEGWSAGVLRSPVKDVAYRVAPSNRETGGSDDVCVEFAEFGVIPTRFKPAVRDFMDTVSRSRRTLELAPSVLLGNGVSLEHLVSEGLHQTVRWVHSSSGSSFPEGTFNVHQFAGGWRVVKCGLKIHSYLQVVLPGSTS